MKRSGEDSGRLAEALWPRVDYNGPNGCWEFLGYRDRDGYGRIKVTRASSPIGAHRVAWILTNGPVPDGLGVLHRCDNPPCVHPRHLFVGTPRDNVTDMIAKGRAVPHSYPRVLTPDIVREIRRVYALGTVNQRDLGDRFGVHQMTISRVVRGVAWSHIE